MSFLKKVELHVHTQQSYDCGLSYQKIIDVCQKRGIDALLIADHNEISGAQYLAKKAPFRVIVGEEILTKEGEIIGLFLKKHIPSGLTILETIKLIKGQGGLTYLPHPFDLVTRKTAVEQGLVLSIIKKVDIVEVYNGRTILPWDNRRALKIARGLGKTLAVGSDAHTSIEIGRNYLLMPDFRSPGEFVASLKQSKMVTAPVNPLCFFVTKWVRFRKGKQNDYWKDTV